LENEIIFLDVIGHVEKHTVKETEKKMEKSARLWMRR